MKKTNYSMKELTIQELIEKAQAFENQAKTWHFHILLPRCKFNEKEELHAFILENESDQTYFVNYSKERHLNEGKVLVKLLYGDTILEKEVNEKPGSKVVKYILEKAQIRNEKREAWEHHLLFPNCILNKNKGKWANIFEDEEEIVESITNHEPVEDLKKIERLYYAQKR